MTLFYKKTDDKVQSTDKNLISGFLTAFQSMLLVNAQDSLETIKFSDSKIYIQKKENSDIYCISRVKTKFKEKEVRKELKKLLDEFINKYWAKFEDGFYGDISIFSSFDKNIREYI